MDVMDAGVYVSKWEALVGKHAKMTLWGPLQAKEMGLDGWEIQDGGETGFVMHNPGVKLTMGRATSTLIFVRRLERAFLTVYFGGYPADAPAGQRKLDVQKVVAPCEMFLGRLTKEKVRFEFQGELSLVDNVNDAAARKPGGKAPETKTLGGGRLSKSGDIIDADDEPRGRRTRGFDSASHGADDETARKAGYVTAKDASDGKSKARKPEASFIDAEVVPKKGGGKGKSEVWEV